jgi:hypothetical protein
MRLEHFYIETKLDFENIIDGYANGEASTL